MHNNHDGTFVDPDGRPRAARDAGRGRTCERSAGGPGRVDPAWPVDADLAQMPSLATAVQARREESR